MYPTPLFTMQLISDYNSTLNHFKRAPISSIVGKNGKGGFKKQRMQFVEKIEDCVPINAAEINHSEVS
jgi:hypothetical protein